MKHATANAVARMAEVIYEEIEGRRKLVEQFRTHEKLSRSLGEFELADFFRQLGDVYEHTEESHPDVVKCMSAGSRFL